MDGWKTTPLSFWGAKGLFSGVNSMFVEEYFSLKNCSPPRLSGISFRDQGQIPHDTPLKTGKIRPLGYHASIIQPFQPVKNPGLQKKLDTTGAADS